MDKIELYYMIATHTYSVLLTLVMSFCYIVWIRPFLARRRTAWLCGAAYAVVMEILINRPLLFLPAMAEPFDKEQRGK